MLLNKKFFNNIRKLDLSLPKTERICPECFKELIIIKGKFGEFIGCTGYPKCQFKKSIYKKY